MEDGAAIVAEARSAEPNPWGSSPEWRGGACSVEVMMVRHCRACTLLPFTGFLAYRPGSRGVAAPLDDPLGFLSFYCFQWLRLFSLPGTSGTADAVRVKGWV